MSKICQGGAHDGASVYLDSQARECVQNGGTIVDDGRCAIGSTTTGAGAAPGADTGTGIQSFSATDAMDQLLLFPLRMVRQQFSDVPLMDQLVRGNQQFAAEVNRIVAADEDLGYRARALLLDVSGAAASALESRSGNAAMGTFTVSPDLIDRLVGVANEIGGRSSDTELRSLLAQAATVADALRGTTIAEAESAIRNRDSSAS
jgi:hypothetical protein